MKQHWIISFLCLALTGLRPYCVFAQDPEPHNPSALKFLKLEAQTALESGNDVQAATSCQKILAQQSTSDEAAYQLGLSLHQKQDFKGAIAAYQKAIELNPSNDKAHLNLGLLWVEVGVADEAIAQFEKVLALPEQTRTSLSNHTIAHYDLAIVYKRLNQPEEAIAHVSKALEITPSFELAQQLLQQLEKQSEQPNT